MDFTSPNDCALQMRFRARSASFFSTFALFAISTLACSASTAPGDNSRQIQQIDWRSSSFERFTMRYPAADSSLVAPLASVTADGMGGAETVLRQQYQSRFQVTLLPSRASLTAYWSAAWGQPALTTQCWMIAAGWATEVAMLSPRVWGSDACGHDGASASHVRFVLHHELVHVLHAQQNRHYRELQAAAPWLVEGIAVAASGQWEGEYREQARAAVKSATPRSMSELWSGSAGYPLAGALVVFAEATRGAGTTARLAATQSWSEALELLGGDETKVLTELTQWLMALR